MIRLTRKTGSSTKENSCSVCHYFAPITKIRHNTELDFNKTNQVGNDKVMQ